MEKFRGEGSIVGYGNGPVGWRIMRKSREPEISPENQEKMRRIADLLGQVDDLLTDLNGFREDNYTPLLNLIHRRIPDTQLLSMLMLDANDSEMRCPK